MPGERFLAPDMSPVAILSPLRNSPVTLGTGRVP
jgi:hypothetical protein